jgi:hypothetical protein
VGLVLAVLGVSGLSARAASITSSATDNATVQPSGPRSGSNGQIFFNMENSTNGSFASFGVVDFPVAANPTVVGVVSLSLTLVQDNAAFTSNGALRFFLTEDTTTNIDAGTSPLVFNATSLPNGIGSQLSPTFLLGTGTFVQGTQQATNGGSIGSGKVDTYTFALSTLPVAAQNYLVGKIDSGGTIRLIVAPDDALVAATYAGFRDSFYPGPRLAIVAITPEPASVVSLGLGLCGLAYVLARRRATAVR